MSRSSVALDNLRAFVILIVLGFHSVLAYLDFLPPGGYRFDEPPYKWQSFAIVDPNRFIGFDLFCAYQDVFLMSQMFFLSGVFVAPSLARKGGGGFLIDRFARLGLPFLLAVAVLMPLTLYPVYRVTADDASLAAYWRHYLALPLWPSGPQWFLWQLLTLNIVAAALYRVWPAIFGGLGVIANALGGAPAKFYAVLAGASALVYLPLALAFNPWDWFQIGPFGFQQARPLHYAVYFFAGAAIGAGGLERGLLASEGRLAKGWRTWLAAALALFGVWIAFTAQTMDEGAPAPLWLRVAAGLSFSAACAAACFSMLSLFVRFATARHPLAESLSDNAYGMYIVHYVFVVWLQYALRGAPLHAIGKAAIVFGATLVLSYAATAGIRCLPMGARVIGERRAPVKASPGV